MLTMSARYGAVAVVAAILWLSPLGMQADAQCVRDRAAAPLAESGKKAEPGWPDVLPSFDVRDWSPRYATGRAHLSTYVPFVASSVLLRVSEGRGEEGGLGRSTVVASLVTAGAGLALGPSMGQWCLGPEGRRQSVLPTAIRVTGIGGMVLGTYLYAEYLQEQSLAEALVLSIFLPAAVLPGLLTAAYGAKLAFDRTPQVRCGREDALQSVSVGPAVDARTGGQGLSLRIRF